MEGRASRRLRCGNCNIMGHYKSAEWILKFVSFPSNEDGSSTGQNVRRAGNGTVQHAVGKWCLQKRSQNQTLSVPALCKKKKKKVDFRPVVKYVKVIVC